ncbi:MAG: hypothetical protein ABJA66_06940 [Actinomycetota bacterium]
MKTWRQNSSIVSRLRVGGDHRDALAIRLRFERLFSTANFHPRGLPLTATLCIKKMLAPALDGRFVNQDFQLSLDWQSGVQDEIEKLYRRAFRPVREIVPAEAESVIFADQAELLASLASDWMRGSLTESWWWKSLFPNLGQAQTVARIWIESSEFVPTALLLLAKQEKAVNFAMSLKLNEVEDLLHQIVSIFGLHKIRKVLFEAADKTKTLAAQPSATFIEKQTETAQKTVLGEIQKLAPWFKFVPEARQISTSFERQCLLGIVLMLARVPPLVRSAEFVRRLKIYRSEFETYQAKSAGKTKENSSQAKKTKQPAQSAVKKLPLPNIEKSEVNIAETIQDTEKSIPKKESKPGKIQFIFDEITDKSAESEKISPPETSRSAKRTTEKSKQNLTARSPAEKKSELQIVKDKRNFQQKVKQIAPQTAFTDFDEAIKDSSELIVETSFGGVFYFLNLGLYLNLYRDFTQAGEDEIDLNIWDFAALLGLVFLGEKIKNDAVWKFLKQLAGRENDEDFGHDFAAPDEWRIPADWLKTFETNEQWSWSTDRQRLVVRHPAGFSVINVRLRKDLEIQLIDELKIYRGYFVEIAESGFNDFPETFMENLTEYVEKRLRQSLNLQTNEQIAEVLLAHRATAALTATHFDVTFRLVDLPFAVRFSGLDRDAGWIPAAGRFVKFHFV